MFGHII